MWSHCLKGVQPPHRFCPTPQLILSSTESKNDSFLLSISFYLPSFPSPNLSHSTTIHMPSCTLSVSIMDWFLCTSCTPRNLFYCWSNLIYFHRSKSVYVLVFVAVWSSGSSVEVDEIGSAEEHDTELRSSRKAINSMMGCNQEILKRGVMLCCPSDRPSCIFSYSSPSDLYE